MESQQRNPTSLLNWMRRLIEVRQSTSVFGRGSIVFLKPANHRVLAFTRTLGRETVLVVCNLAGTAQVAELDMSALSGAIPIEMFGGSIFPRHRTEPYAMMMGPLQTSTGSVSAGCSAWNTRASFRTRCCEQLMAVGQVDILVGLPTLNNAATVVDVGARDLQRASRATSRVSEP